MECNQTQIPGLSLTGACHIPVGGGRSREESALYTVRSWQSCSPSFYQCGPWQSCVLWLPLFVVTVGFILLSVHYPQLFSHHGKCSLEAPFTLAYTQARPLLPSSHSRRPNRDAHFTGIHYDSQCLHGFFPSCSIKMGKVSHRRGRDVQSLPD